MAPSAWSNTIMDIPIHYEIVIEPGHGLRNYWRDIWRYRELLYFLAWRDILVRYKQTVIGIAWSVVRPFLTMVVLSLVFGKLAGLPSQGVPYPILVFAAMLPWQFFAGSLTGSSNSLIGNSNLISKVYFPRMIMPFSAAVCNLVDFFISFIILLMLMGWYRFTPSLQILAVPVFLLWALIVALGFGLWLAALNVQYRDFTHIVPFLVQFGLYIAPVGFSSNVVPERWKVFYSLNPMVGVIDGFRWAILGEQNRIFMPGLLTSLAITCVLFISGVWYFRKTEKRFADVI